MRICIVLLLAACGRLGFDAASGNDGGDDTIASGTADLCDVRTVGSLTLGTASATAVRAVALPSGYAVAVGTSANNIHVARVTGSFTLASEHIPLRDTYTLGGISALGATVFVHSINSGTAFLKRLDPSWDTYSTIDDGDNAPVDPPLAPRALNLGMRVRIILGQASVDEILEDGTLTGLTGDYRPQAVRASIAPAGDAAARVVVEAPGNACETFVVSPNGTTSARHTRSPCANPRVIVLPTGAVMSYGDLDTVTIYFIPSDASGIGSAFSVAGARSARIAPIRDAVWVLYQRTSTVELKRIGTDLGATTTTVPITAPYDLLPEAAFWVDGQTLRVATPCLR